MTDDDTAGGGGRSSRSRRAFLGAAAGTAAALAGCSIRTGYTGVTDPGSDDTDEGPTVEGTDRPRVEDPNRFTAAYRATVDSVAVVRAYGPDGRAGQGSGFVYDGQLVTNQHVVAGADTFELGFARQDWTDGEVVGADVYSDLAVLDIADRPEYATDLSFVDSEPPVGTEVVAVGAPFGLGQSVSAGIVSGVDRSITGANNFSIPDAVQTDAAANPGNSGGPLVDLDANVVGVVNSGGGDNIAFGISAALCRRVIPALAATGDYRHAYMGVALLPVNPVVAEANDLDAVRGAYVDTVRDGDPADGTLQGSTGSETINNVEVPTGGDVIVALDGEPIDTLNDLSIHLALETSPGDTLETTVVRDGTRQTVAFELGRRPRP